MAKRHIGELRMSVVEKENSSELVTQKVSILCHKDAYDGSRESSHEASALINQGVIETMTCGCEGFMSRGKCRHMATLLEIVKVMNNNSENIMNKLTTRGKVEM